MEQITKRRSDSQSWLLLLLALGPIFGIVLLTVQLFASTSKAIEEVDSRLTPALANYELQRVTNSNYHTLAVFNAVRSDSASQELLEKASAARTATLELMSSDDDKYQERIDLIAQELDLPPTSAKETTAVLIATVARELEAHKIGEKPSSSLEYVVNLSRAQLSLVPSLTLRLGDDELGLAIWKLIELSSLNQDFVTDVLAIVDAEVEGTPRLQTNLRSADFRGIVWEEDTQEWEVGVNRAGVINLSDIVSGMSDSGARGLNPVAKAAIALQEASIAAPGQEPFSPEFDRAVNDAFDLVEELSASTDQAALELEEVASNMHRDLARRRLLLVIGAAGLITVGVGLFALTLAEVRERRRVEAAHRASLQEMADKAHRDPATGSRNRRWMDTELAARLDGLLPGQKLLLVYLDLDRFKTINDVWGHHTGDEVLRVVALRLRNFKYDGYNLEVVRFGGDEFVCFTEVDDEDYDWLAKFGQQLVEDTTHPIVIDGRVHELGASAGVTLGDRGAQASDVLLEADSSLILAKRTSRGRAIVYDRKSSRTGELVRALPNALTNGEITCDLQPIYQVSNGKALHFEALARWHRSSGETVGPDVFVPLIESFGLGEALTRAVLTSVRDAVQAGKVSQEARIWVNVSPVELNASSFADQFLNVVNQLGLDPNSLGIEVTETAAVNDTGAVALELSELRSAGIETAIDDFGAGYTPLGFLRGLPIDVVKIDRALIADIDVDFGHQKIVEGIIGFVRSSNIDILAEGVETEAELEWLLGHGIEYVQGYLFARPQPWQKIELNCATPPALQKRIV